MFRFKLFRAKGTAFQFHVYSVVREQEFVKCQASKCRDYAVIMPLLQRITPDIIYMKVKNMSQNIEVPDYDVKHIVIFDDRISRKQKKTDEMIEKESKAYMSSGFTPRWFGYTKP